MIKILKYKSVSMDTQTIIRENGEIDVIPCPWAEVDDITEDGKSQVVRGSTRVMPDGNTSFRPFNRTGKQVHYDYKTRYTTVQVCKNVVVVKMKVPRNLCKPDMLTIMDKEYDKLMDYFNDSTLVN